MIPRATPLAWLVALLLAPGSLLGQEYPDLVGRVVDGESGVPVTAASVSIIGRAGTVQTGDDGTFRILTVRVDDVTVLIQRLGYFPLRVRLQLDAAGEPVVRIAQDLPLRPVPLEVRELIVELQDPWLDAPFQAKSFYRRDRLFTRDEIRRTPNEMPALLERLAGAAPIGCEFDFYLDGEWVNPVAVEARIMSRPPIEFESAEVYYSNARMGQRESAAARLERERTGIDPITGGRDLAGMTCGVFRLWSLGHRQLGDRQYVGPMDEALLGPIEPGRAEVRGVVSGAEGRPVLGMLMTLVDESGAPVSAGVTDALGRYVLRAPAPATYVLTAFRPGQPEWTSEPFAIAEGQVLDITPRRQ